MSVSEADPRGTGRGGFGDSSRVALGEHSATVRGRQGEEQISTEGVEDAGTVTRVITGGAGNYTGFVGEQRQTFLGFNPAGGVNLRVTFILRPVAK